MVPVTDTKEMKMCELLDKEFEIANLWKLSELQKWKKIRKVETEVILKTEVQRTKWKMQQKASTADLIK
jgi:hypothetical protein